MSSTPLSPQPIAPETRRVPKWAAVTGAVLFCVLAAGFIWSLVSWFQAPGTGDLIPDPTRAERMGRRRWQIVDGVEPRGANQFLVRSGPALMDIYPANPRDKSATAGYRFRYNQQQLMTPDQWHLSLGLMRVGQDAKMAETLAVTPDQLTKLRRLAGVAMEASDADKARLIACWQEYQKSSKKAEAEKKLVAMLKEVGDKSMPATRAKITQRVIEIGRVLTAEQMKELMKLGAGQPITPLAKPKPAAATTRPAGGTG